MKMGGGMQLTMRLGAQRKKPVNQGSRGKGQDGPEWRRNMTCQGFLSSLHPELSPHPPSVPPPFFCAKFSGGRRGTEAFIHWCPSTSSLWKRRRERDGRIPRVRKRKIHFIGGNEQRISFAKRASFIPFFSFDHSTMCWLVRKKKGA